MKQIPAGKFKTHCLSLLDEVARTQQSIVVTKYGKPVARVVPYSDSRETEENPLKGCIIFQDDIVSAINEEWEAQR